MLEGVHLEIICFQGCLAHSIGSINNVRSPTYHQAVLVDNGTPSRGWQTSPKLILSPIQQRCGNDIYLVALPLFFLLLL
jgi:hypothetical protein